MYNVSWNRTEKIQSKQFRCGYCGNHISSDIGYHCCDAMLDRRCGSIYICHFCNFPTFFNIFTGEQIPGSKFGDDFDDNLQMPEIVKSIYEEARSCFNVNAFTACGMACRKLLMNIAVDCGAEKNLKFIEYVDYLEKENYIPRNSKAWVDKIRTKGNDASHHIDSLSRSEAELLLEVAAMIITNVYKYARDPIAEET